MTASLGRNDGIFLTLNKEYAYDWKIYSTLNPQHCFGRNYQLPLPNDVEAIASGDNFNYAFQPFLDTSAPDDVFYCYMFTGRGIVETSAWGYKLNTKTTYTMTASRDKEDGILIEMEPPITSELSELFATPDIPPNVASDKNNCPATETIFSPPADMRYVRVLDHNFSGKQHLDTKASFEIDLCYFLVSKKTNKVMATATGYRILKPE
ncbi:MAG: hypothetical protein JNL11_15105 [Bdellovibrionaceae bacterium]|nr:hypothetical protein [Pseudobdellovibrionaceae bacterium]